MGKQYHFLSRILMDTELLGESMPGEFLIEIFGNRRVLIENHLGVLRYDPTEICVRTLRNCLCICGDDMQLAEMTKYRLIISGNICGVQLK